MAQLALRAHLRPSVFGGDHCFRPLADVRGAHVVRLFHPKADITNQSAHPSNSDGLPNLVSAEYDSQRKFFKLKTIAWGAVAFHDFFEESQSRLAVASLAHKGLQDFTLVINSPPQIMCFTIDEYKHFIKMPTPVGIIWRRMNSLFPNFSDKHRTKTVPPIANCFVTYVDTSLM